MSEQFPVAHRRSPVRAVGLTMAREGLDLTPVIEDDGALCGVLTMRALARRYIHESREPESLGDSNATVDAVLEVLDGELVAGERGQISGRIWVSSSNSGTRISPGDVVVVGDREDAQRHLLESGAGVMVSPNGQRPSNEILGL